MSWPNVTEGADADHITDHADAALRDPVKAGTGEETGASTQGVAAPAADQGLIGKLAAQQFQESDVSLSGAT